MYDPKVFERIPQYGSLVGGDVEQLMRSRVRRVLKHHKIIDGVIEADIVSTLLPLVKDEADLKG